MNLSGSYGLVLSNRELPPFEIVQREVDRRPCLFSPTLLVMGGGASAACIRVHDTTYMFGCEAAEPKDVVAPIHGALLGRWTHAFVFRDDGTTIGASLSAMVAEAAARAMSGTLYDRRNGIMSDYGDLIHRLDGYLDVHFDDLKAYLARYPEERPGRAQPSEPVNIEARVFPGRG